MGEPQRGPLTVTELAGEVVKLPECQRLLEFIPLRRKPVEGPSMTSPQRSYLAQLPRNWVGSTIEFALRLELCRPGSNRGYPLSLEAALQFLIEDELYGDSDARAVYRELAAEFSKRRTPLRGKSSAFFDPDELIIPTSAMRAISKACGLAQRRFGFLDPRIEEDAFNQMEWAEALEEFHVCLFNAAVWVGEKQLAELGSHVTDAHVRLDGYSTRKVSSGEYDFSTGDRLLDLKCSHNAGFQADWMMQLLMYWRIGLQTTGVHGNVRKRQFERFRELGVVNPLWGEYCYMQVDDIPHDVVEFVDEVVLEFERPVVIGERAAYAITDIGEEELVGLHKAIPVVRRREEIAFPLDVSTGGLTYPNLQVGESLPTTAFQPHEIVLNWFTYETVNDAVKAISLLCAARDVLRETDPDAVAATGAVYADAIPRLMRVFKLARSAMAAATAAESPTEVALAAEVAGRAQRLFDANHAPLVVSSDYNVTVALGSEDLDAVWPLNG